MSKTKYNMIWMNWLLNYFLYDRFDEFKRFDLRISRFDLRIN